MDFYHRNEDGTYQFVENWSSAKFDVDSLAMALVDPGYLFRHFFLEEDEKVLPDCYHILFTLLEFEGQADFSGYDNILILEDGDMPIVLQDATAFFPGTFLFADVSGRYEHALLRPDDITASPDSITYTKSLGEPLARVQVLREIQKTLATPFILALQPYERKKPSCGDAMIPAMFDDESWKIIEQARTVEQWRESEGIPDVSPILQMSYSSLFKTARYSSEKRAHDRIENMKDFWTAFLLLVENAEYPKDTQGWEELFYDYALDTALEAYDAGTPLEILFPRKSQR